MAFACLWRRKSILALRLWHWLRNIEGGTGDVIQTPPAQGCRFGMYVVGFPSILPEGAVSHAIAT